MFERSGIYAFLFLFIAATPFLTDKGVVTAQDINLEGRVIDANTEEPLIGVNIEVLGTTRGTTSDLDGNFTLSVSEADTLQFSYLGYQTKEVPLEGRSSIEVELMDEAIYGEEVVFVGYGTRRVEDNTGSISSISSDDFNPGSIRTPEELIQGRVPGVDITSADGAPGSAPTVRIRGGSSLSASNDPLYVIDDVPIAAGGVAGMANPMNTINTSDIESMNVLRDASATAIYGSRASNGVIVIQTKRGQVGRPLSINYSGSLSYETLQDRIEPLSADQYREVVEDQVEAGVFRESALDMMGDADTDWQDQIFRNVVSQNHNVSVSGAVDRLPFHVSLGFTGDRGLVETSQSDRLTGSINLSPSLFDDQLDVDFNIRGSRVDNRFADDVAINNAISFDPTQPVTVDDGDYGDYFAWLTSGGVPNNLAPDNPVAQLEQRRDESVVNRTLGNLKLDYTLPFNQDLTATMNLGFDYASVETGRIEVPENAAFAFESEEIAGEQTDYDETRENQVLDLYLNYSSDLENIMSSIDATAGYSWEHNYEEGSTFSRSASDEDQVFTDVDYRTENYLVSFFGRVNYSFMDRYRLTATMRADGSSRFAEGNRWGYFPSMALAWSLDQESFLDQYEDLTNLTLRLGYGVTGQQEILQGDYPYLARYTRGQPDARYRFGNEFTRTLRPEGFDANLQWEETTTYNIALDYGFFNDRLRGTLEAYHRETENLLNETPIPGGSNFTNRIISNVGSLEVQGLEFEVTGTPVITSDTRWQLGFNLSRNVSEITQLTLREDPDFLGVTVGDIAGGTGNTVQLHRSGDPRNIFFLYQQVFDEQGNPIEGAYVDQDGSGTISDPGDMRAYGSPEPDVTFGFFTNLDYRGFDASISTRAQLGNYVYNNVASQWGFYDEMEFDGQYLRNAPESIKETNFVRPQYHSDYYLEDASFLKIDNISLGYTFEDLLDTRTSARLSATVNNVYTFTNYSGLDPEMFGGIDGVIYPRPRTFEMGVDLSF